MTGNKYFSNADSGTAPGGPEGEFVRAARALQPGADAGRCEQHYRALYQSNGFINVKVTPEVKRSPSPRDGPARGLSVTYHIDEGMQERIGNYQIAGNQQIPLADVEAAAQSAAGQPVSPATSLETETLCSLTI